MQTTDSDKSWVRSPQTITAGLAPSRIMRARFLREVKGTGLLLPVPSEPPEVVSDLSLKGLPSAAQRYLRFMDVLGRPRTRSFRARAVGAFRMGPDKPWTSCEAWQYDARGVEGVARIFHMRMRMASVLPVLVRDTYLRGHGRMRGRILDSVSVVDQADEMIATGELVTYLNDCIFLAPSMLLGPETTWSEVIDDAGGAFDVTLTDRAGGDRLLGAAQRRVVTARVFVDDAGRVTDFSTTDRFGTDPDTKEMIRARWSTPVEGWTTTKTDGRRVATGGKAVWHFAKADFAYADFRFDMNELVFDVATS